MMTISVYALTLTSSISFTPYCIPRIACLRRNTCMTLNSANNKDFLSTLNENISKSIGRHFTGTLESGGFAGGSGSSVGIIVDPKTKESFFYKSTGLYGHDMLRAEYLGVKEIFETKTIKVPRPICYGTSSSNSFVVFEKLNVGGSGSSEIYATQLADMHRNTSPNGMFGFYTNNTIGATFQPNCFEKDWPTFYDKHRLGHILTLARRDGLVFHNERQLREKVFAILSLHTSVIPSLVHGDLWSGNQGYTSDGSPVIFDPSVYYGDREVDIAMTKLFGMNSLGFYTTYEKCWPRPKGWEIREIIYNLYHILNHYVLFGGSYSAQATRMVDRIMAS